MTKQDLCNRSGPGRITLCPDRQKQNLSFFLLVISLGNPLTQIFRLTQMQWN